MSLRDIGNSLLAAWPLKFKNIINYFELYVKLFGVVFAGGSFGFGDDFVDDAVGLRLFGIHEEVPLYVFLDLLKRLAGILGQELIQSIPSF